MPYDAATLGLVEHALVDCFKYHSELDLFLTRSGVSKDSLALARVQAEKRAAEIGRYPKAPKRFVVQEVLGHITALGSNGDTIAASIITALLKGEFRNAAPEGLEAIEGLRSQITADRDEQINRQKAREAEASQSKRAAERHLEEKSAAKEAHRDSLMHRFMSLLDEENAQRRGYLLEVFLNDLFEHEGLEPRSSFKLLGEQIDGSITWRNRTCLVEAKWVRDPVSGKEFGAFDYKIDGKTADTRGLYISINGYSAEAIQGMNAKGALKFVCIDGAHIIRALYTREGLAPILTRVWRHADETGESYLPVSKL
jgi:hypothetical protein